MATMGDESENAREDIPLKSGRKSWNEDCFSGLKFVNCSFGTLTFIITVALLVQIYYGDYQVVPHGSVATDSLQCSRIGTSILKKGGNAVDAAVASAICLSLMTPHVTGLDAEGQMLIYSHKKRDLPILIDFSGPNFVSDKLPKLVLGLVYAQVKYGTLTWKELIEPSLDLARNGFLVTKNLVQAISQARAEDLYGHLEPGQTLKMTNLATTLEKIANMSVTELNSYLNTNSPAESQALKYTFNNYNVYVPSSPSAGAVLGNVLKEIEKFNFKANDTLKPEYIYRLAETTQIVYSDNHFNDNFHRGTVSTVSVMGSKDYYVSLVTGMFDLFGSGEITSYGYVLDVKNKTKPCSRLAIILTDRGLICGKRIVFGVGDVATASQLIANLVLAGESATKSVEAPRFYVTTNGSVGIEGNHLPLFNDDILKYLESITSHPLLISEPYDSINIVAKLNDDLSSHSDSRGGGIASRF